MNGTSQRSHIHSTMFQPIQQNLNTNKNLNSTFSNQMNRKRPDNASSSSLNSALHAKKRRVETGMGDNGNLGNSWWRFGEFQLDLIKGLVDNPSRSISPENANVVSPVIEQNVAPHLRPVNTAFVAQKPVGLALEQVRIPIQHHQLQQTTASYAASDLTEEDSSVGGDDSNLDDTLKFRAYQAETWTERFEELLEFRSKLGHCLVPNNFPANPALAQWVKRQRYQYKLKQQGKRSTLSEERMKVLEEIGFVWDSHSTCWEERLKELLEYRDAKGDCNVPSRYNENRQLAVWVKRQRRQYKFFIEGKPSSMTHERIAVLEGLGFNWDLRGKR